MFVSIFGIIVLLSIAQSSPIKRSLTDQLAAADCYGTECSYDTDYYEKDVVVNVNIPQNITDVIVNFIPEMLEKQDIQSQSYQQQMTDAVKNMTMLINSQMQRQEQQMQNMTHLMENINSLLHSQLKRLPIPPQRDCQNVFSNGFSYGCGVYTITPGQDSRSVQVYCDMETDGGPWTVFQKRFDGSVDFYLGWTQYENGFGSAEGEYWLGLRHIHALTQSGQWQLRVDMEAFDGDTAYALYDSFSIDSAASNYRLHVSGYCNSGTAGDSLTWHNGMAFSTRDRDNDDSSSRHCAEEWKGSWWYWNCHYSNLNGLYLGPLGNNDTGNVWHHWKYSRALKSTEMKIRRIS